MSRHRQVHGNAYRSFGKSAEVVPDPEWRAEKVLAMERLKRREQYIRESTLSKLADAYRPKEPK